MFDSSDRDGKKVPPAPPRAGTDEAAELSKKRLAMIVAFVKDPTSDPLFKDRAAVYRLMEQERAYQQALAEHLARRRDSAATNGDEASRQALEGELETALSRQAKVFKFMKELTGKKGRTGGTGMLARPKAPPAPTFRNVVLHGNDRPDIALSETARSIAIPQGHVDVPLPPTDPRASGPER